MKAYELRFEDGYTLTVLATFDEMISLLDSIVLKHGDCRECFERVSYDKYTGTKYNKIW